MYEDSAAIVSKMALFQGIAEHDLESMLSCLRPEIRQYRRNEFIATAGEPFASVGIILAGEATVIKENAAGSRTVMAILAAGDIFGETIAFSGMSAWPVSVQAQDACRVLFLTRISILDECARLCPWHRSLIRNFLGIVSEKALMLNKMVEYLTIKSIRGKIGLYLLDQYRTTGKKTLELPLRRNELADYLNVSRPSLSREMGHMKREGIIDYHLRAVRILDLEALKQLGLSG